VSEVTLLRRFPGVLPV
jgi:hypothetical protein